MSNMPSWEVVLIEIAIVLILREVIVLLDETNRLLREIAAEIKEFKEDKPTPPTNKDEQEG